nr:PKD domain-containing protein [Acanthopleuribacter pedis]
MTASPSSILNFGDTALVTVRAVRNDGRPVLDGVRIQFSATAGSITSEATTVDGVAQAVFTSDAAVGTVAVNAASGAIGADGSVTTNIEVIDRVVEISSATLALSPSNIGSNGGLVETSLVVLGPAGEPLAGKAAVFSTTFGSLNSNGATLFTDASGRVRDVLAVGVVPAAVETIEISAVVGQLNETATLTVTQNQTPTPEFLVSPESVNVGQTVFFNASPSTDADGIIRDYCWSFGDGNTGVGREVSHVYNRDGAFIVSLTVVDDRGAAATTSQTVTVGANQPPSADFTFSPTDPRVGDAIFFDASTSSDPDGTIEEYRWSLGNGIVRGGQTLAYAYPGAGAYNVVLTVTDNNGVSASSAQTVTVLGNQLPTAAFSVSPTSPRINDRVVFDGAGSSDPDGEIVSWRWQFGDRATATASGRSVEHRYLAAGTYQVVLEVTDNDGGVAFETQLVTVSDLNPPTAAFTFNPTSPRIAEAVVFDGSGSSNGDAAIETYRWTFGNGETGTGTSIQHRYFAAGTYLVTLTVTDTNGLSASTSRSLTVGTGGVPNPVLNVSPESLTPPGGFVLVDGTSSTDAEDRLDDLRFSFRAFPPEGVTVNIPGGDLPIRQIEITGLSQGDQVPITMTVLDSEANQASATRIISAAGVADNATPVARFTTSPATIQAPGGTVVLDGSTSTDADHALDQLGFFFTAQVVGTTEIQVQGSGPLQTALIQNAVPGDTITIRLTVEDPLGAQNAAFRLLQVDQNGSNTAPVARLTSAPAGTVTAPANPSTPMLITLDASDTTDADEGRGSLNFAFNAASSDPNDIQFTIDNTNTSSPFIAEVRVVGLEAGDQLNFSVTVTDSGGLSDQDALLILVTN